MYINTKDLSIILDMTTVGIYYITENRVESLDDLRGKLQPNLKHENIEFQKIGKYKIINLNQFVENHKLYDFKDIDYEKFIFLEIKLEDYFNSLPDYIPSKEIISYFGYSRNYLNKLKDDNKIKFITVESKKNKYLYYKNDILNEVIKKSFENDQIIFIKRPKKLFYKIKEIQEILNNLGIETSQITINRRILNHEIPAIRVRQQLRIPIPLFNEIKESELSKIFSKKK